MAMEKKSLVSKKAPASKSKTTSKVDISKPEASKVVAARKPLGSPNSN
jgi:hypothetical protein